MPCVVGIHSLLAAHGIWQVDSRLLNMATLTRQPFFAAEPLEKRWVKSIPSPLLAKPLYFFSSFENRSEAASINVRVRLEKVFCPENR